MSLIKVNSLEAYTGTSISVMSNILFKNVTTGSAVSMLSIDATGKIISGSSVNNLVVNTVTATNYVGLPTDVRVTGGTYSNGTATFRNNTGGTFTVTGFKTSDVVVTGGTFDAGTATFTNNTGGTFTVTGFGTGNTNISDSIYTVDANLNANNTSTATTSVMIYGVNVFTGVTATNFATKLPQPVTGKSVKVINNGTTLLHVFPSNIGGQVNNLPIDTPAVIPPDGNLYEFICIKNPLPGAWTFSTPATGQYDSGDITISISAGTYSGLNPLVVAYNQSNVGINNTFNNSNWGYNGKNKSNITSYTNNGKYYLAFRPDTPWQGISKIKVYTNLLTDSARGTQVRLLGGGESGYYSPFDDTVLNTAVSSDNVDLFLFDLTKKITGADATGSTIYSAAKIGAAGTVWDEIVGNSDYYSNISLGGEGGTFIGNKSLGTAVYPYSQTSDNSGNVIKTGDIVNKYYSSYISFQIKPFEEYFNYGVIPDFKFRFIIEYYQ